MIDYAHQHEQIGYTESHHIIPKSMGGAPKDPSNRVKLTARQHLLAHFFLWKAYRNRPMTRAYNFLSLRNGRRLKTREYAAFKEGMSLSEETKAKISKALTGKPSPKSDETRKRMSKFRMGMTYSAETKRRMSESAKTRTRKPHTEESRYKMSEAAKIREQKKKDDGYKMSENVKKKLSVALSGKPWSEARRAAQNSS